MPRLIDKNIERKSDIRTDGCTQTAKIKRQLNLRQEKIYTDPDLGSKQKILKKD